MPKKVIKDKGAGRPKLTFTKDEWNYIFGLCELQCTAEEIAGFYRISVDTLERRIKEEFNLKFAEFFAQNRTPGQISLRRSLFRQAQNTPSSLIFALKNHCGMRDTWDIDLPNLENKLDAFINAVKEFDTKTD